MIKVMKFQVPLQARKWLRITLLAALPVILFAIAAERKSWLPRIWYSFEGGRPVEAVAVSPDGITLVAFVHNALHIIDVETQAERSSIATNWRPEWPPRLRISKDNDILAESTVPFDQPKKQLRIWNATNGKLILASDFPCEHIDYSSDGRFFYYRVDAKDYTSTKIMTVRSHTGKVVRSVQLTAPTSYLFNFCHDDYSGSDRTQSSWAVSPNGRQIVVESWERIREWNGLCKGTDTRFAIFDAYNGELVKMERTWPISFNSRLFLQQHSRQNRQQEVRDAVSGAIVSKLELGDNMTIPHFSPDGNLVACVTIDSQSLIVWNTKTGRIVREIDAPITDGDTQFDFSPDSKWLFAGTDDGNIISCPLK